MDNGWETSAAAWIADMGEHGDFGRRYVLDEVMLRLSLGRRPRVALDVGCGEGRFCRMLQRNGVAATGVDPTAALVRAARHRDATGVYIRAAAERLPFDNDIFDLVVSYLSLIDIPDIEAAIPEMARVLRPGGALLIANLTSFNTASASTGWIRDANGDRLYYAIDNYLQQRSMAVTYRAIRIVNHHRPLKTYMRCLLNAGLELAFFDEPEPCAGAPVAKADSYRRAPWYVVMEWLKTAQSAGADSC